MLGLIYVIYIHVVISRSTTSHSVIHVFITRYTTLNSLIRVCAILARYFFIENIILLYNYDEALCLICLFFKLVDVT